MEKEPLNFTIDNKNYVTVFRIDCSRLDSSKAPELKTEFLRLIAEKTNCILVDLSRVEAIDSSGLGALLFGLRQILANNGNLKLTNLQPKVVSLLKIAKLDRVFEIFDDEESGIKSFS